MDVRGSSFVDGILRGETYAHLYSCDDSRGLIQVWQYRDVFILTWEECPDGMQYDEDSYTRDERMEFSSIDSMLAFFEANQLTTSSFERT